MLEIDRAHLEKNTRGETRQSATSRAGNPYFVGSIPPGVNNARPSETFAAKFENIKVAPRAQIHDPFVSQSPVQHKIPLTRERPKLGYFAHRIPPRKIPPSQPQISKSFPPGTFRTHKGKYPNGKQAVTAYSQKSAWSAHYAQTAASFIPKTPLEVKPSESFAVRVG
jgi:hypothetical protein